MSSAVISLGAWGGSGGQRWSCIATNGIKEIIIREDTNNIKCFSFTDASDVFSGTFGYPGGEETKIAINWPSEYLMAISGTYGEYEGLQLVLSLSFITNVKKYGPFGGSSSGVAFSIPITDSAVAGFFGRSGYYLDAIGIYVKPADPGGSVSVGPWGGSGGGSFTAKLDPGYIKQITVAHNGNIKFMSFKDANGQKYGPLGGKFPPNTEVYQTDVIEIGDGERLTSMSGTVGNYNGLTVITSLSFVISSAIKGPYGTENGTPFSVPMEGSEVIGFFGKDGWYLDSIGLYVKPLEF